MTFPQPFLPYGRQTITEADVSAVVDVIRSIYLTQGPAVHAFEQAVPSSVGAECGVEVRIATSALHLAGLVLGLGPGDRHWTTPITCVASVNCARYCSAEVNFVDIDPATGMISVAALTAKLEQAGRNGTLPKVLVTVHLCGTSCTKQPIAALADCYGFAVVEDASHAIGGHTKGDPAGNCRHSAISVFSLHPVKIITIAEGSLATNDGPYPAQRMVDLRNHGITKGAQRFELPDPGPWSYKQQDFGFIYRMTDLQVALGLSQLQQHEAIVSEHQDLLDQYRQLLAGLTLQLLEIPQDVSSCLHLAVIRLADPSPDNNRRGFEGLRATGIGVKLHYTHVHLQPCYNKRDCRGGIFPGEEVYTSSAFSLPLSPGMQEGDQQQVVRKRTSLLAA